MRRLFVAAVMVVAVAAGAGIDLGQANAQVAPVANPGGPYTGVVGVPIQFNGSASTGLNLTYFWNLPGGVTLNGPTPSFTFQAPGTYGVTLIVQDVNGLTHRAHTSVRIGHYAGISAGQGCGHCGYQPPVHLPCQPGHCGQVNPCQYGHCGQVNPCQYGHCGQVNPCQYGHCGQVNPCQYGHCGGLSPCVYTPCGGYVQTYRPFYGGYHNCIRIGGVYTCQGYNYYPQITPISGCVYGGFPACFPGQPISPGFGYPTYPGAYGY